MFVYKVVVVTFRLFIDFEKELNLYGVDGWELISTIDLTLSEQIGRSIQCVFKRKVS